MFTTGTKLLVGSAVLAAIAAVAYGVFADGTLGVIGLVSASVALALLAGINVAVRDSYVTSMDEQAVADVPAARPAPAPTLWPVAAAVGAGTMVLGLVSEPIVFILGLVVLLVAGFEWMLEAWSESASADLAHNLTARARLAGPLEFPLLGALAAAVVVYSFSRIMLFLSKTNGPIAFGLVALLLLVFGFIVARRPSLRSGAITALCTVGAVGLVAGGVATGLEGERDIEKHETTGALAEEQECMSEEETHADENASQSVAATANVHAIVTLNDDGVLLASVPSVGDDLEMVTFVRSNPTNVLFRNETDHDRRLTLDLGEEPAVDENGEAIEGETEPHQLCTALVEEGGEQMLTIRVTTPSHQSATPYRFVVPGVDGQSVEVVVP